MNYREQFIAAWVTQQQRAFSQSTRGIMTPEDRQILEDEAEKAMAEAERDAALAAVERVRALLQPTLGGTQTGEFAEVCGCGKDYFPCEHAAAILAALDGAPEPEEKP